MCKHYTHLVWWSHVRVMCGGFYISVIFVSTIYIHVVAPCIYTCYILFKNIYFCIILFWLVTKLFMFNYTLNVTFTPKNKIHWNYIYGNQDTSFFCLFVYGDRCFRNKQISNFYLSPSLRKKKQIHILFMIVMIIYYMYKYKLRRNRNLTIRSHLKYHNYSAWYHF